jgi:hypothetical protein
VPRNTWGTEKLNHFKVQLKPMVPEGSKATGHFKVKVRFDLLGQGFRRDIQYFEYGTKEIFIEGMKSNMD